LRDKLKLSRFGLALKHVLILESEAGEKIAHLNELDARIKAIIGDTLLTKQ
jgi:hypothetical protein